RDHHRVVLLTGKLQTLNPKAVLERGYAIVWNAAGKAIHDPEDFSAGLGIRVEVATGEIDCTVNEVTRK
ncbi:MAG: exodeoxyribonuclease VII large subunit, partial [Acidobacteria bacterium]|nr:exodeoxyribonuclease VII large subunit [Acidobacteriota bacterium]